MERIRKRSVGVCMGALAVWILPVLAGQGAGRGPAAGQTNLETIRLLHPNREKGIPLMQALGLRRSTRTFSGRSLSSEHLSEVPWAAAGINREDGKRTAPSAWNRHSVEVFAVLGSGVFRYVADGHLLEPVVEGDFRSLTGVQDFVGTAPLNLVYVTDLSRFSGISSPPDELMLMAAVEAGHMAENVYLYCSSEGLGAVTRTLVPRDRLAEQLGLGSSQRIVSAQTVGYPE